MRNASRGNILFLILLAVILFAALSYAVISSMRGGGKSAETESVQAKASWLLNYFAQLDTAVQRMMTTGGVKDYELNFYYLTNNKYITSGYDNPSCTESRCRVFDPAGGGVSGQLMADMVRDTANSSIYPRLFYIAVPGAGTDKPDIVMFVYKANTALCKAINKQAGLGDDMLFNVNSGESGTLMYFTSAPVYPIPDTTQTMNGLPVAAGLAGTFCSCRFADVTACESSGITPAISHVLVAR